MAEGPGPSDAAQSKKIRVRRKFGPGGGARNLVRVLGPNPAPESNGPWRPAHERDVRGRVMISERDAREREKRDHS